MIKRKPRKRKKLILEGSIELAFMKQLKNERPDAQAWKQNGRGHAARPDREVILAMGLCCFIEFKRPGEFPTKAQQLELDDLEALNHKVAACDTVGQAMQFIYDLENCKLMPWRKRWGRDHL